MANLMELLQSQLAGSAMDQLTEQMPGAQQEQTGAAANLALSTIMNALNRNAQKPGGIEALSGALEKNHSGGILDNLGDLLNGRNQSKEADGMGILGHLLGGGNIFNVVEMISKGSGLSRNNSMSMLMKMAPVVMGMLGKQKKQQQMQPRSLQDLLNNSVTQARKQAPEQDLISRILDKDGDGSAMDEIAGMGLKVLGNLFRK